jgi:hypothetical protein
MVSSIVESIFQAPSARSLGLGLELRLRNTARRLGSGDMQEAQGAVQIDLRAYQRGRMVFHDPCFGEITPGGSFPISDFDVLKRVDGSADHEEETLFVARLTKANGQGYFSQEHQLTYTTANGAQAYLLYDQQPLRLDSSRPAPLVLMMPKVWVGGDINTYIMACNASNCAEIAQQPELVQFLVLDERGQAICTWEQRFFYNEARAFNLRDRIAPYADISRQPRFFNLVGRGGAGSFVFFAVVRNTRTEHLAIEHSLPPIYYMDGDMQRVRAEACNPARLTAKHPL